MRAIDRTYILSMLALFAVGNAIACPSGLPTQEHSFHVSLNVSSPVWDVVISKIQYSVADDVIQVFATVNPTIKGPAILPTASIADTVTISACGFGTMTRNVTTFVDASRYEGGAESLKKINPGSNYEIYDVSAPYIQRARIIFSNIFVKKGKKRGDGPKILPIPK
ncbi:MAG: hypothetical protein HY559_04505 [Gammaproteobacteria bacterium]|nr:hypothetical protein [Gammaproteobacteria bacterium]